MKKYIISIIFTSLIISCNKEESQKIEIPDSVIVDVSLESEWDYWISEKEGSYMFVDIENNKPTKVYLQPSIDMNGYPIFFDQLGFPEKAIIQDHIFLFNNFSGYKMDITAIAPNGNIYNIEDIEGELNWDQYSLKSSTSSDIIEVLKVTSIAISAFTCVGGIITAPTGVGLAGVAIGCGSLILAIANEYIPEGEEILGIGSSAAGAFSTTLNCISGDGVGCILGLSTMALELTTAGLEDIENNELIIGDIPIRISTFLNEEHIETLTNLGLVFNKGITPPNIEGYFYVDNWKNLNTSATYINYSYNFYNQQQNNNIDFERCTSSSNASGSNGYISGEESNFTVYFESISEITESDNNIVTIKTADVYSGVMAELGISNLQYGFIILEKENDINDNYMNVGNTRIVYESDFMADEVGTYPFDGLKSRNVSAERLYLK